MELLNNISQTAASMFFISLVLYVLISTESSHTVAYEFSTITYAIVIMLLSLIILALTLFTQLMIHIWS